MQPSIAKRQCTPVLIALNFCRHMVLPIADETAPNGADAAAKNDPCFSVLLHGSLKKDNKVAFARVASDWYGVVSFWADSKNKSNLVLSLLSRGHDTVPWLGGFRMLGPASLLPSDKRAAPDLPTFPVHKKGIKRSYAQSTVAWTRPTGLQTDVQKILRSAKKLPEKSQVNVNFEPVARCGSWCSFLLKFGVGAAVVAHKLPPFIFEKSVLFTPVALNQGERINFQGREPLRALQHGKLYQ